jgi:hypothetical protein
MFKLTAQKFVTLNGLVEKMPEDMKYNYDQIIDDHIGDLSEIGIDIEGEIRNSNQFKRKDEEELIKTINEIKKVYLASLKIEEEMIAYI